tara:strand:- start:335 stop:502 length:168 start_codon:yes stop_codon:yes gene_type:complete
MNKKTQQILLIAGVGVIAYMLWKKREENSSFSNVDAYDYASGRPFNLKEFIKRRW